MQDHQQANDAYLQSGVTLLELASRAADLFAHQPASEKRRLLDFVLSNSTWANGELTVEFRQLATQTRLRIRSEVRISMPWPERSAILLHERQCGRSENLGFSWICDAVERMAIQEIPGRAPVLSAKASRSTPIARNSVRSTLDRGTRSTPNFKCGPCRSPRRRPPAKSSGRFLGERLPRWPLLMPEPYRMTV